MRITTIKGSSAEEVLDAMNRAFDVSRFTIGGYGSCKSGRSEVITSTHVKLGDIRLKREYWKPYCGNHPSACVLGNAPGPRAKPRGFLEGADWVSFNDMLNDVLDAMNVSASVGSSFVKVRRGRLRRINYGQTFGLGFQPQWDPTGSADDYEDWCGIVDSMGEVVAPASNYPFGTPGLYTRLTFA